MPLIESKTICRWCGQSIYFYKDRGPWSHTFNGSTFCSSDGRNWRVAQPKEPTNPK